MVHGNLVLSMKKFLPSLFIAGSIIGAIVLYAKDSYNRLIWRIRWTELRKATATNITLAVVFEIYNPTIFTIQVGKIRGDILINDKKVGVIDYPINRPFYKKSVNQVTVLVQLNYSDLGNSLYEQIMRGNLKDWILTIDGKLDIQTKTIKFKQNFIIDDFKS